MSFLEFQTQFIQPQPMLWLAFAALLGLFIGVQIGKKIGAGRAKQGVADKQGSVGAVQTLDDVIAQEQQQRVTTRSSTKTRDGEAQPQDVQSTSDTDDASATSAAHSATIDPVTQVSQLVGVSDKHLSKLAGHGISSIDQLIEATKSKGARETLADELQLEDFVVNKWARMAGLTRLPNMSAQVAEFLVFAGINSTHDLAERNPESLFHKLQNLNQKEQRIDQVPSRQQFESWSDFSKDSA